MAALPFGDLLRRHRLAQGISQEALAERAKISVGAVGALEQGARRAPYRDTVSRLADALGVSPEVRRELEAAAERGRGRQDRLEAQSISKNNLPTGLTSFLGRQDEIARIEEMLETSRLVTLTGSGGIGKTRLAIEAGRDLLEQRKHEEIWFVDLSALHDASFVAATIADVLGLSAPPVELSLPSLEASLRRRACLLILDNCEHLVDVVAEVASALLRTCPGISILATSRERLAIEGERVHRLPSLAVPATAPVTPDEAYGFASLKLFFDRAAAAGSVLTLAPTELKSGAEICRRLEGIPLAIELAASRAPSLGLEVLARRLSDHLAISGTRRDLPERQRTMTAAIAWSYGLLSDVERALLRRVAVFRGGMTIDAVETIAADRSLSRSDLLDLLSSLFDKSLLTMSNVDERPRYTMLEVVRSFLMDRLSESGEVEMVQRAHLRWMASVAELANEQTARLSRHDWLREFGPELDNTREALARALEGGHADDAVLAARIAGGLRALWVGTWRRGECQTWCRAALERIDEDRYPLVTATLLRAYVQCTSGREMIAVADRALQLLDRIGDRQGLMFIGANVALERSKMGDFAGAEDAIARSFALAADGSLSARAELLLLEFRWQIRIRTGDLEEARLDLERQALLVRQLGEEEFERLSLLYFEGCIEFAAGNVKRAVDLLERTATSWSREQLVAELRVRLVHVAAAHLAQGELDAADDILRTAMDRVAAEGYSEPLWHAVQHLATLRALRGHVHSAARLAGFVENWGAQNDRVPDIFGRSSLKILENLVRQELSAPVAAALIAEGSAIRLDQALEEALA
jgi:predicted ATPase/plasmid maintenance system antidote protein VapI